MLFPAICLEEQQLLFGRINDDVSFQVSLDARVREIVNRNMVEPTPHTFDDAQLQIYTLMHRDSYPRFVNSALYRTLAQQQQQQSQCEKDERSSVAPEQDGPGPGPNG